MCQTNPTENAKPNSVSGFPDSLMVLYRISHLWYTERSHEVRPCIMKVLMVLVRFRVYFQNERTDVSLNAPGNMWRHAAFTVQAQWAEFCYKSCERTSLNMATLSLHTVLLGPTEIIHLQFSGCQQVNLCSNVWMGLVWHLCIWVSTRELSSESR